MTQEKKTPKVVNFAHDLEVEIGHLVTNADVRNDIIGWLDECENNIEKCLVMWVTRDEGKLRLFGTHMKCLEAIGYLEVAKGDLLDYMCQEEDEEAK